jgi:hypothetical protein
MVHWFKEVDRIDGWLSQHRAISGRTKAQIEFRTILPSNFHGWTHQISTFLFGWNVESQSIHYNCNCNSMFNVPGRKKNNSRLFAPKKPPFNSWRHLMMLDALASRQAAWNRSTSSSTSSRSKSLPVAPCSMDLWTCRNVAEPSRLLRSILRWYQKFGSK